MKGNGNPAIASVTYLFYWERIGLTWSSETVVLPIYPEMSSRIWATEPYLRNGSVPNLSESLKSREELG
jgi:hypothetical protein